MSTDRPDFEGDIVSILPRPAPSPKFDYVSAVPTWPRWQLDEFTSMGLVIQQFWTNFEDQIYMLKQWTEVHSKSIGDVYERHAPTAMLFALVGSPKPGNRNWTLRDVATIPLSSVQPGQEAREEIAALRRKLPELLAQSSASKKT